MRVTQDERIVMTVGHPQAPFESLRRNTTQEKGSYLPESDRMACLSGAKMDSGPLADNGLNEGHLHEIS